MNNWDDEREPMGFTGAITWLVIVFGTSYFWMNVFLYFANQ